MKKLWEEFKAFINKGNALSMAIGVIIGGAFTKIVTSINKNIISPLIGAVAGNQDLSNSLIQVLSYKRDASGNIMLDPTTGEKMIENAIYWGTFIQAVIDFLLTAIVLFAIFKIATALKNAATKAALKAKDLLTKDDEEKKEEDLEEEKEPEVKEPTMEEKQLALLESINENLLKLNGKKEEVEIKKE